MISKTEEIINFIVDNIKNQIYKVGEKIPTEKELCGIFGVSRMTVNKAIQRLALQGIITPKRGYGTTVNPTAMEKELTSLTSFTEDITSMGIHPITKLLEFSSSSRGLEKEKLAMGLNPDTVIYKIKRLRLDETTPIAVDIAYINSLLIPTIDASFLEGSLYDYLENQLGIKISHMQFEIKAIKASKEIAGLLHIPLYSPVLKQTHTTYTSGNRPFEYVETFYNPEKYSFSSVSYRKGR